jgi:hypothetical protein
MARPPQLTPPKQVFHVRLSDDRKQALEAEAKPRGTSPSDVIRLHLERYAEMVWRDLPKLDNATWCAVFEALGPVPVDIGSVTWIGSTLTKAVEETELCRKWKVDSGALLSAVRAWTFGQACAVADAAIRFQQALTVKGTDAIVAARQATTRPAAFVLEAPTPAKREGPTSAKRARSSTKRR